MTTVQRWLIACVAVDCGHQTIFDADVFVQHLRQRSQAVGGAGAVGDHVVIGLQQLVVHAEDDGLLNVFRRGGDQNFLGAAFAVFGCFIAVVKVAGAFQHNVNAGPVQLVHVIGGEHADRTLAHVHGAVLNHNIIGETTVYGVIADQVCRGFQWAGCIHFYNFHVVTRRFRDMHQRAASDAAKAIDTYGDSHQKLPCSV